MNNKSTWDISSTSWSHYWKHRNLKLFDKAPENLFESDDDTQDKTLSDWNRQIISGKKCTYFINGVSLSDIAGNNKFERLEDFKAFLGEKVFAQQTDLGQKGRLIEMTASFCYQAGLFHATSSAVSKLIGEKSNSKISLSQPEMRIDLKTNEKGLTITETNAYRKWIDNKPNAKKTIHECGETKPYYVKTETTYAMTPDKIELLDLHVDCPSRNLAPFLDERDSKDQLVRFPILKNIIAAIIDAIFKKSGFSSEPPEPQVLHDRANKP